MECNASKRKKNVFWGLTVSKPVILCTTTDFHTPHMWDTCCNLGDPAVCIRRGTAQNFVFAKAMQFPKFSASTSIEVETQFNSHNVRGQDIPYLSLNHKVCRHVYSDMPLVPPRRRRFLLPCLCPRRWTGADLK